MSTQKNDKTYTAAELERYHKGSMPPAEMFALEKAAMEDQFLADALEGYADAENAQQNLNYLSEKINTQSKSSAKVVFFPNWLKIAAIFILVAGAGLIGYKLNTKEITNTVAVIEPKLQQQAVIDKPGALNNETPQSDFIKPTEEESKEKNSNKSTTTENVTNRMIQPMVPATAPSTKNDDYIVNNNTYSNNALNNSQKKGASNYNFSQKQNDVNVDRSMQNQNFDTYKSVTVLDSVTAEGLVVKDQKQLNTAENKIKEEEKKSQQLSEVIVTGYGTARRKEIANASTKVSSEDIGKALNGKVAGLSISNNSTPVDKPAFDKFIADSIKAPVAVDNKPIKGEVELSFIVNKNGIPKKIKVVKSLCGACDEEAIRLLKNGPKWTYAKGKRTTTTISF